MSGGAELSDIAHGIVNALDPDTWLAKARAMFEIAADAEPTDAQVTKATDALLREAVKPLATQPKLRDLLATLKKQFEQIIDEVSVDELREAGYSEEAKLKARSLIQSFKEFIEQNKDEIDALRFFYNQPYGKRLKFNDIKKLAEMIQAPPRSWTPERLWRAYETLEKDKVRGAASGRLLTDIVSLVRFTLHQEDELSPYAVKVAVRFDHWIAEQRNKGRSFNEEQLWWLTQIRDHVAQSLELELEDFDLTPFVEKGGLGGARKVFGGELGSLVKELNEVLSA